MNTVNISGNLTRDITLRETANGTKVASFTVAVNEYSNGESQATFVPVTCWSKQAEFVSKYFEKGASIEVVGKLHNNEREIDGKKYTFAEIWATQVSFVPKGKASKQPQADGFETVNDDNGDLPF